MLHITIFGVVVLGGATTPWVVTSMGDGFRNGRWIVIVVLMAEIVIAVLVGAGLIYVTVAGVLAARKSNHAMEEGKVRSLGFLWEMVGAGSWSGKGTGTSSSGSANA